ncbi:MAG: universal stress protein [Candidatus Micrarchaeota archaeon]
MRILLATTSIHVTKLAAKFVETVCGDASKCHVFGVSVFPSVFSAASTLAQSSFAGEDIRNEYLKCLRDAEDEFTSLGAKVETHLLEGIPSMEILSFAEKEKVDIIMIGGEARRTWEKFIVGSVGDQVIKNAKVPVVVLH